MLNSAEAEPAFAASMPGVVIADKGTRTSDWPTARDVGDQ